MLQLIEDNKRENEQFYIRKIELEAKQSAQNRSLDFLIENF